MFRTIRRVFIKVRVVISAIRSGLYGFVLVWVSWLFLAPPSATETDLLSLPPEATAQDGVLRAHRMAKVVVVVATDRIYALVADQSDDPVTAAEIKANLTEVAEGRAGDSVRPQTESEPQRGIDALQKDLAKLSGPKFVPARTTP